MLLLLTCGFFRLQAHLHAIRFFAHLGIPVDTTVCSPLSSATQAAGLHVPVFMSALGKHLVSVRFSLPKLGCGFHLPHPPPPIPHCDSARTVLSLPWLSSVLSIFVFGDRHQEGHSLLCVAQIARQTVCIPTHVLALEPGKLFPEQMTTERVNLGLHRSCCKLSQVASPAIS